MAHHHDKLKPTEKENINQSIVLGEENDPSKDNYLNVVIRRNEFDTETLKETYNCTEVLQANTDLDKTGNVTMLPPKPTCRPHTYINETIWKKERLPSPPPAQQESHQPHRTCDLKEANPPPVPPREKPLLHIYENQPACPKPYKPLPICADQEDIPPVNQGDNCDLDPSQDRLPVKQMLSLNDNLFNDNACALQPKPKRFERKTMSLNEGMRNRTHSASDHPKLHIDTTKKMTRKIRMKIFDKSRGLMHKTPIPNSDYKGKGPPTRDILPDDELWAIASELRCEWVSLANDLGYTKSQVQQIENVDPHPQTRRFLVLAKWQSTYDDEHVSVRAKLSVGLTNCQRTDLVEKVKKKTYHPE